VALFAEGRWVSGSYRLLVEPDLEHSEQTKSFALSITTE
jgi:hypothetical protein